MSATGTNVLSLSGNGLNINYNLGPDVSTLANSAYSFINGTSAAADAFEGNSIAGTESFLTSATAPIVSAVAGESDAYYSQILGAFDSSLTDQTNLANIGENVEGNVSQASISASKKASGSGSIFSSIFGGCFITTAVCKYSGRPDNCDLLQTMRAWRNGWMSDTPERIALIADYYATAPACVARIERMSEGYQRVVWGELEILIKKAAFWIHIGNNHLALNYYLAAVEYCRVASESLS